MKKYQSVGFNFIMNFILTLSNFIFPLITFPYVSRVLGAEGIGTVTFATSIISYFTMIGMLGIPTYGIRACAKVRDDEEKLAKTVQELMLLNALVMGVSLLALMVAVSLVDRLHQEKTLYMIMSSALFFNVLGVDWLYKALERYTYITLRSIAFKFLSLLLMFWLVKDATHYVIYGGITIFAAVGSNFLNFINLKRLVDLKPMKDLNLRQHIGPTLSFFLLTVSTQIYLNMSTTLLGFIKDNTEVGYYSAAVKVKQILVSVVTSLGTVLLPRLSYYYEKQRLEEFRRLVKKALNFVFVLAVPLVVYFILNAEASILFLSGRDFLPATLPMQLVLPSVLFIGLSNLMGMQILVPTHREKLVVYSTIVGAVVALTINAVLTPLLGARGSALAGSVAELSVVMIQAYYLRDLILPMFRSIEIWKITLGVTLSSVLIGLLKHQFILSNFWLLVSTGVLFFASYGLVLLVLKESFVSQLMASVWKKIRN